MYGENEKKNKLVYQLLSSQIQILLNKEFTYKLKLGKYSQWAINLTIDQTISIVAAIGQFGRLSPNYPNIKLIEKLTGQSLDLLLWKSIRDGKGLDELLGYKLRLNNEQHMALNFLDQFDPFWLGVRNDDLSKISIPFQYSINSPKFPENVYWAMNLTSSDLFGIIWITGYFITRLSRQSYSSINLYEPRAQHGIICMMRIGQGKTANRGNTGVFTGNPDLRFM